MRKRCTAALTIPKAKETRAAASEGISATEFSQGKEFEPLAGSEIKAHELQVFFLQRLMATP
jgi:hypothetical protein